MKINFAIALGILLWSLMIGPEEDLGRGNGVAKKKPIPHEKNIPLKSKMPDNIKLKRLEKKPAIKIDQDIFQLSFRRQSYESLLPCLEKELGNKGSINLKGTLVKTGKLVKVKSLSNSPLPTCANQAFSEMNFLPLIQGQSDKSIELYWSIDW